MAKDQRDFTKGRMNKSVDERLLPAGEYIDAQNVRLGSTELSEVGAVENSKGNVKLTTLKYNGVALSGDAICIGALDDSSEETMYWFVHDPNHQYGGVVDMIVSFNTQTQQLTYHVVTTALLNFNPTYLVNGVNLIDDLLFFTDNYNPPRKINVTRAYPQPIAHADQITELDISVIKPQPMESPVLTLQTNIANDNFMEDSFICFAYRYKYRDGEYSATSQFSDPAFYPSDFSLERRSYMNAGMINSINSVDVAFNTGGPNVIGIDVVFKEMDSNVIWVAKKLNKATSGYQDNSTENITFSNGDIYTILNQSEILRAYDGVPRLAKAQTIMGNRIMYGNYLEGYDIKDEFGSEIDLTYVVEQSSETESSFSKEEDRSCSLCLFPVNYTYTGAAGTLADPVITRDNEILVDISGIDITDLIDGSQISVSVEYRAGDVFVSNPAGWPTIGQRYYPYTGSPFEVLPDDRTITTAQFVYEVQGNHTSYNSAFNTQSWEDQKGNQNGNYQQSPSQYTNGYTFTDNYNGSWLIPPTPINANWPPLTLLRSAWQSANQTDPFEMYVDGNHLHVLPNGFQYTNGTSSNIYMIPEIVSVRVTFNRAGNRKSLHSNRDYQVGIVYQDAEGRQTTALESIDNSFHISAYDSENINWATVTIPPSMRPPYWADRYKFVMKQTETDYETIYITAYFPEVTGMDSNDPKTGRAWLMLEGENADKVTAGQELYVKVDSSGAVNAPTKTTVLEVRSMAEGDIYQTPLTPAGVYMRVLPDNFTLDYSTVGTVLTHGSKMTITEKSANAVSGNRYPDTLKYRLHGASGAWPIPAGSTVKIRTHIHRREYDRIEQDKCGRETCNFNYEGVATVDYNNLRDFWLGEGLNIGLGSDCGPWGYDDDSGPNSNTFYPIVYNYDTQNTTHRTAAPPIPDENHFQFTEKPSTNEFWLEIQSGTHKCWGGGSLDRASKIECEISIFPVNSEVVFETIPASTAGEIYYENGESFEIVAGNHMSGSKVGDVSQDIPNGIAGVVNLGFFNCYSFFNGVEGYKIRDSVSGKKIYLGNRVTAVSDQDYKEIRRESSITYSGIYNNQNNINRLNEFNIGQANYKDCESSYGPIQLLHGRRSDLLALQEDRISYIAIGKNMLVTAAGEGILTSVPEILGVQVARSEEYGISENPESFAHYGSDIYFTDAKRSSVIQLKGDSAAESLSVVSNNGMRSWFRDLFQTSFGYQKLGGYDPYMDEYVLSPNTNLLPAEVQIYGCGGGQRMFTGLLNPYSFVIEAGRGYGNMTLDFDATHEFTVTATYNGVDYPVTGVGAQSISFDKDVPSIETITITITPNDPNGASTIALSVSCPVADIIKIIPVTITSASDAGSLIHNSYTYFDTTVSPVYQSGYQIDQVQFLTQNQMQYLSGNIVSRFGPVYAGPQGTGSIPIDNADVAMYATRMYNDTFDFDPLKHRLKYLRVAPTLSGGMPYENNAADINALLAASADAVVTGAPPAYEGLFPMPAGGDGDYLYLIWEYRNISEMRLCYAPTVGETCCECFSSPTCFPFLGSAIAASSAAACALPNNTNTYYLGINPSTIILSNRRVYGVGGCGDVSSDRLNAGFINFDDNGTARWIKINSDNIIIDYGTC